MRTYLFGNMIPCPGCGTILVPKDYDRADPDYAYFTCSSPTGGYHCIYRDRTFKWEIPQIDVELIEEK